MRSQPPLPTIHRGGGTPVLFLHGFAVSPSTYHRTVGLLAQRVRVLLPMWMYVEGEWSYPVALDALEATVDAMHLDEPVLVLGHSAGGALALGLAARRPDEVRALVLVNSLGASDSKRLRRNAVPGRHLARLASLAATRDFFGTVLTRPRDVGRAALWAYRHRPDRDIDVVRSGAFDRHVVWAERDGLLPPEDGRRFASRLDARFTRVADPDGEDGLDHDWPYRRPDLFVDTLAGLGIVPGPNGSR